MISGDSSNMNYITQKGSFKIPLVFKRLSFCIKINKTLYNQSQCFLKSKYQDPNHSSTFSCFQIFTLTHCFLYFFSQKGFKLHTADISEFQQPIVIQLLSYLSIVSCVLFTNTWYPLYWQISSSCSVDIKAIASYSCGAWFPLNRFTQRGYFMTSNRGKVNQYLRRGGEGRGGELVKG